MAIAELGWSYISIFAFYLDSNILTETCGKLDQASLVCIRAIEYENYSRTFEN